MRYRALKFWQSHPWRLPVLSLWAWRRTRPVMIGTPWVVWKIMEFYNKVEKKVEVMRRRIFRPTEVWFFFSIYTLSASQNTTLISLILFTTQNTYITYLTHYTQQTCYPSYSQHTTLRSPICLTSDSQNSCHSSVSLLSHNTHVTHLQ